MNVYKAIEVMTAFADGAEIEYLYGNNIWRTVSDPTWNWYNTTYRVKEEVEETYYEVIYRVESTAPYRIDITLWTQKEIDSKEFFVQKTGREFKLPKIKG